MGGNDSTVAVIGGGLLGLTLAHRLARSGASVTVFEGADELGGLAAAWQLGDVVWDRHYHVTLLSDSATRRILDELGLAGETEWVETKTGLYANGRLYPMSSTIEYLRLPVLSVVGKARLATTILAGSRMRNWKKLEQEPVEGWLARWSGRRVVDEVWLPLLRAKLGESYRESSAAFIWATIQRLYAARRTGLKKEMLGYVHGGYARTLTRFAEVLTAEGVDLRLGTRVTSVERADGGGVIVSTPSGDERFESVVVTANPPVAARICTALTDEERERLASIKYQGIVCVSLLLRRPLAPYYLTYITDSDAPFTAVVEMTAFVDPSEVGGHSLVYLPKYTSASDPIFSQSDDAIVDAFVEHLSLMHPGLADEDVITARVSRVPAVFPIPVLGYSNLVPSVETSVPGLYLASSAQIVNGTLNVNETVTLAEEVAVRLQAATVAADEVR